MIFVVVTLLAIAVVAVFGTMDDSTKTVALEAYAPSRPMRMGR